MWDYVRYGANDFLGEITLDLGHHPLDDEAEWYILQPHQDTSFHSVSCNPGMMAWRTVLLERVVVEETKDLVDWFNILSFEIKISNTTDFHFERPY